MEKKRTLSKGVLTLTTTARSGTINHSLSGQKKKNPKRGGPWRAVFWIALVVFLGSLIALGVIVFSYFQGQSTYKDIAESAVEDFDGKSLEDMTVDWDTLLAQNPDTVGWVYIPDTVVNYPIVHTTDDEKYLTVDFLGGKGEITTFGTIFLSAANSSDFSDANNIVYGHHMNDGSMFAVVDEMRDSTIFNQHRDVYILTPHGNYRLQSFSLVICDANDPLAQTSFASPEEQTAYVQDKIDRSVATPDSGTVTASEVEKIFAFVTCDYTINDGRAVLFASVVESTDPSVAGSASTDSMVNPDDIMYIEDAAKEIK